MANTLREGILAAAASILTAAGVASGHVYRSRAEALARDELPAVVVKPGAEQVTNDTRGLALRRFQIKVEIHARGTPADSVADPVAAAAHAALMADQTLGSKVARLVEEEMTEPEFADGDDTAVMVTLIYAAIYATPTADTTRLANS